MKAERIQIPDECDELLREWARYFKDRHFYERARSLEGHFQAASPGSWDEGWGSQDEIPPQPISPPVELRRVLKTHDAVMSLEKPQRWATTYGYCYPHLERWRVLMFMKKYTGRRVTWSQYLECLDLARLRVWARLSHI